jgi:hypothetical protein
MNIDKSRLLAGGMLSVLREHEDVPKFLMLTLRESMPPGSAAERTL